VAAADPAYATRAARVRERFVEMFWNEQYGCLYDVIDGERRDPSIRPNQIFAISLPYPLLDSSRAERVLEVVERKLLTPVGLRTLPEDDPRFVPRAVGSPRERDAAYHQGTVWPWLLGPYITALVRVRGQRGVAEGRRLLAGLEAHLGEAGVGTISEIFDGAPPHAPRGCIGQAWSVGEVLRVLREDLRGNVA
jgi:glycogen debranching enzyme